MKDFIRKSLIAHFVHLSSPVLVMRTTYDMNGKYSNKSRAYLHGDFTRPDYWLWSLPQSTVPHSGCPDHTCAILRRPSHKPTDQWAQEGAQKRGAQVAFWQALIVSSIPRISFITHVWTAVCFICKYSSYTKSKKTNLFALLNLPLSISRSRCFVALVLCCFLSCTNYLWSERK